MNGSNLENKVVRLQEELDRIKTPQRLGGDNYKVYQYYIEGSTPSVNWTSEGGGIYYFLRDEVYTYNVWTSGIIPVSDIPSALLDIEKLEVWRDNTLLTGWSNYQLLSGMLAQKASSGEKLSIVVQQLRGDWHNEQPPSGYRVILDINLSSLPAGIPTPFVYTYKVWLRSSSPVNYQFVQRFEELY